MKAKTTWILVADGARARILQGQGPGQGLIQIPDGVFEGSRDLARDVGTDRPGRSVESVGGQRHAVEPHTPMRDQIETAFLQGVVDRLDKESKAGRFDALVVVAAPHALGTIRKIAPAALQEKIVATLDKDLTRAPIGDVEAAVKAVAVL